MQIALEERTTGHAAYTNMERVIQTLNEIDTSDLSSRTLQMLGRISSTFDFLKEALDKADPWLVPTSTMDNINSPISQVLSEITNYKNYRNEGHLTNVLSYLETLLLYFPQVSVTKTPEEIEGVRSSVIKFRQSVGQHLSNLEKEATEVSTALNKNTEKLNDLTTSIESQKNRIDTIVNDFQGQFLQTQTSRNELFHTFIKESEVDFNDTLETYEHKFKQQIIDQADQFKAITDDFRTKAQAELDQINAMNKEAEKIIGIISMNGLAHGYQKIANNEGKKAFWWNFASIVSMIGVIILGVKFLLLHEGAFDWTTLISRIVLTGIGLTLFTYCAKQATNHRNEERRNRKIELELASLDPYLKDLEPEKQKEVKQTLVNKYFGVELSNAPVQQAPVQQQNIIEAITNNPQFIQSIIEKLSQSTPKQY
ncbi:hypothetical protein DYI25_04545 [Mesobacillus boroniphilus]|uniref:Uncharacterized protein n=1 Tax=Mesobacillus boroniphilus TaxID=308892 RepID=A0A944CI80_9BACI|nr:hypothetical protein [Mesobacillus boroniphilus]MBS8263711.1 hypothetical protein [Mesobacillus boroniphilus]